MDTLEQVCLLRAESIRRQLDGEIPATIRGQQENPDAKVDASVVKLTDLGDFEDLESAKERQDAALRDITGKRGCLIKKQQAEKNTKPGSCAESGFGVLLKCEKQQDASRVYSIRD